MKWSLEFECQLISFVEQNECLWNLNDPHYKDTNQKERTWALLAQALKAHVSEVKHRWQNLRRQYRREHQRTAQQQPANAESNEIWTSKWIHFGRLSFLANSLYSEVAENNSTTDIVDGGIIGEQHNDSSDGFNAPESWLTASADFGVVNDDHCTFVSTVVKSESPAVITDLDPRGTPNNLLPWPTSSTGAAVEPLVNHQLYCHDTTTARPQKRVCRETAKTISVLNTLTDTAVEHSNIKKDSFTSKCEDRARVVSSGLAQLDEYHCDMAFVEIMQVIIKHKREMGFYGQHSEQQPSSSSSVAVMDTSNNT